MAARTAQEAQHQTNQAMMQRLFKAPEPHQILGLMLLLGVAGGFLLFGLGNPLVSLASGLVLLALPVVVAGLVTKPIAEALGGKIYLRRSTLLALFGLIIVVLFLLVGRVLQPVWSVPMVRFLLVGWGATLWLRQVILLATSNSNPWRSLPAGLAQPLLALIPLAILEPLGILQSLGRGELLITLVALAAFGTTGLLFTSVAIGPLTRGFGVDGLAMLRYSLDHWTEHGDEGREQMEGFFDAFAARVKSRVGLLVFRGGGRTKALLIVPTVHPGPFGQLGGSNLPEKLLAKLEDLTPAVLVAHGPSTHDQNLATSAEVDKIGAKVRGMLADLIYGAMASPMVRVHHGAANVCVQVFGGTALVVASQAPKPTDDLDAATGHAAVAAARAAGVDEALVVDAHNSLESGSGMVPFGSEESYDIVKAAEEATGLALKRVGRGLRVGYACRRTMSDPLRGLGPMGIQALAVEAAGQRTAYLLFDGNNMVPGLREEIRAEIQGLVDEAEVLTSDNHVVNAFIPGFNPVGLRWDHHELVSLSRELVQAALGDLEPAEAGAAADFVEDVHIWGHQSAVRLTTAIQSIMAGLRINAAVSLALGVAISIVALLAVP